MTNREKYAAEMRIALSQNTFAKFYDKYINPVYESGEFHSLCHHERAIYTILWLAEEYSEPEVDWSKVPMDMPIFVRDYKGENWRVRHFAEFKDGKVYAWEDGCTSWTANRAMTPWKYVKLAEAENE